MADRHFGQMTLKVGHVRIQGGKISSEQNIRIRHTPSKRANNINSSLLFSLGISDDIVPDWGTLLEDRADYCNVEMQKLLGRKPPSLQL